ncbi:MAG TPA: hypothetical protein VFJ19_13535 [Nocardioidaceae bacterium]|nr:hypothetical protein [Nocardioidaceae bacterium]
MTEQAMPLDDRRLDGIGAQQCIDRLRATLMGGRGPGATATELAEHQHARTVVGAVPVTLERERVSLGARAARGDTGADTTARRATTGLGVSSQTDRRSEQVKPQGDRPVLASFAVGVLLGAVAATVARGRRRSRTAETR